MDAYQHPFPHEVLANDAAALLRGRRQDVDVAKWTEARTWRCWLQVRDSAGQLHELRPQALETAHPTGAPAPNGWHPAARQMVP